MIYERDVVALYQLDGGHFGITRVIENKTDVETHTDALLRDRGTGADGPECGSGIITTPPLPQNNLTVQYSVCFGVTSSGESRRLSLSVTGRRPCPPIVTLQLENEVSG